MRPFRCTSCGALSLGEFCELQHHRATPVTAKGGVWSPRFASSNGNVRRCRVDTLWSLIFWWDVVLAHLVYPMCFCFPKCPNVCTHVRIWRSRVQGLLIWGQSETLPRISCANSYKFMSYGLTKTPLILERLFRETTSSAISTTHDESTFHLQSSDEYVNLPQVWSLSFRGGSHNFWAPRVNCWFFVQSCQIISRVHNPTYYIWLYFVYNPPPGPAPLI